MSEFYSERLNSFGTASIPKLVLQFSVPAIISMCVNALYNIVDRFFVGQGVGSLGIAGITLCFPICLFIMALSMMVGVGGNTLFAIRLGQKKYIQASIILNNSFSLLIIMAVLAFTFGEIFMTPLLKLFGASEQTLPVAESYMRILLCGAVFQTIAPGMNHFIRSMGHPKTAMFREIAGAVTNIILDWLFIMKFHWGIEGAAWATICSQLVASSLITQFFVKKSSPIKIRLRHMKLHAAYVRKIYILGLPPSVMQICNSLMNAILAWSLTTYGNISQEEDQGDVHHDGEPVAGEVAQGVDVLEAEEDHRGADNTHEGTTGDETAGEQRAALLACLVDLLILAAGADEPADDGADEQRSIELQGDEHTQGEGQSGHLEEGEYQGNNGADAVE